MREVLDILNEARHYNGMPEKIRVQNPADFTKHSVVWTRPEITWEHMYPFSYHDEIEWQKRIPGESKHGKTLCHEEGDYIYFLLEQPSGKSWDLIGTYDMKDEMLYFDTLIRNFESWMGSKFTCTMIEI